MNIILYDLLRVSLLKIFWKYKIRLFQEDAIKRGTLGKFNFLSPIIKSYSYFSHCQMASSEDSVFEKHADKIAQILQRMAEDDVIFELRRSTVTSPSIRNAHELTDNSKRSLKILGNFERLFRRKLRDPNSGIITLNCCWKFLCFVSAYQ